MIGSGEGGHGVRSMAIAAALSGSDEHAGTRDARLRAMIDAHFDFAFRSLRRLGVPAANADDAMQNLWWVVARR